MGHRWYALLTEREGWCWFFGAIDHHTDEVLGWHVVKLGDRRAVLEPIRQGVRHSFGGFGQELARGLRPRCAWGPLYIADAWIDEVKWLGITIDETDGAAVGTVPHVGLIDARAPRLVALDVPHGQLTSAHGPGLGQGASEVVNRSRNVGRIGHRVPFAIPYWKVNHARIMPWPHHHFRDEHPTPSLILIWPSIFC